MYSGMNVPLLAGSRLVVGLLVARGFVYGSLLEDCHSCQEFPRWKC